jgi:hypothetical protein
MTLKSQFLRTKLCSNVPHLYYVFTHTLLDLLCFIIDNLFIRVLANALSEITNCSSMTFKLSYRMEELNL